MLGGSLLLGVLVMAIGLLAIEISRTMAQSSRAILSENVSSLKAAEELEIALLDQKGIATNYLLDGDAQWLEILEAKRQKFSEWFTRATEVAQTEPEQHILSRIGELYREEDRLRYEAILLDQQGKSAEAQRLLYHTRQLVDALYDTCEELLFVNEQLIAESMARSQRKVAWLHAVLWGSIVAAILLGLVGGWLVSLAVTKRLAQSEKLATLGEMAGLVAHEVRNPLTAISLRVHSLQDEGPLSASGREDLEVIRQEIERLERIVRNFLDLVKLPQPRLQPIAINEAVGQALLLLRPTLERRAVQVHTQLTEVLPPILADPEQLKQVLLNLLLNSAQAMPEGGTIGIATALEQGRASSGTHVTLSISDTGSGIAPEVREKIFEPFFTTRANGTGLGLSLAKKIIELHQGGIAVREDHGPGTTVTIHLPASRPEPVPA